MEALRTGSLPVTREGNNGSAAIRPRASSERDGPRNRSSSRGPEETRSPSTLPKAFQGMLKTTTETGDIGMFSIKPSRVSNALNSPRTAVRYDENLQKPRQSFQPYGVPGVDDRRRLPSYARDATSEVISMYETASQKSGNRGYEDPDGRSYSMTQTSYSSYTLSNHRSYASLRSQQDANGLLQRPRSPFAYPARLKRPGFRPSSPALTDGGVIDYSRRAEIDRQNGHGLGTSSPSSLYAFKRKPPLSLRNEANKSTPSLLSHSSPPRQSPSPNIRQSSGNQGVDWSRRHLPTSRCSSPARSTFSLASTVNLYSTAGPASTTTTPGKVAPPSPLYYDYTEDFDVDDYNQPEPLAPPPTFLIDRSIPEDRPVSAGRPLSVHDDIRNSSTSLKSYVRSSSGGSVILKSFEESDSSAKGSQDTSISVAPATNTEKTTQDHQFGIKAVESKRDTQVIRLSGLGYGAQELSTHVEEAFGLPSSPSFEISISESKLDVGTSIDNAFHDDQKGNESPSARSSGFSFNTHIQRFPRPPDHHNPPRISHCVASRSTPEDEEQDSNECHSGSSTAMVHVLKGTQKATDNSTYSKENSLVAAGRIPNTKANTSLLSGKGLSYSAELMLHGPHQTPRGQEQLFSSPPQNRDQAKTINLLEASTHKKTQREKSSKFFAVEADEDQSRPKPDLVLDQVHNQTHNKRQGTSAEEGIPVYLERTKPHVPKFTSHIYRQMTSRAESPILAPKPISPARQLRLKNSVPQLMKALPPVPLDLPMRDRPPQGRMGAVVNNLPCRFSPLLPETALIPAAPQPERSQHAVQETTNKSLPLLPERDQTNLKSVNIENGEPRSQDTEQEKQGLRRLKLKGRYAGQPRQLQEHDSPPWNQRAISVRPGEKQSPALSPVISDDILGDPKPKFRLRVTRASESSQGTVRINRGSSESRPMARPHFRNPKDLFSSSAGLDHMLRQVNKHLHSRKTSSSQSFHEEIRNSPSPSTSAPTASQISDHAINEAHTIPDGIFLRPQFSPSTAQSTFSDDSSRNHGKNRLRTRISNLRTRIAPPYVSRNGIHSCDDINWAEQGPMCDPVLFPIQSAIDLPSNNIATTSTHGHNLRDRFDKAHARKFKAKVKGWLREARSTISARMKSRSGSGRSDDERAQLTADF